MTLVAAIEAVVPRRRRGRMVRDDRLDDVVDGAFLPPQVAERDLRRPDDRSPVACSRRTAPVWPSTAATGSPGAGSGGAAPSTASWIVGGVRCDDDTFRLCFFDCRRRRVPRHLVHVRACAAPARSTSPSTTRSCPVDHTIQPGVTRPSIDTPLGRLPELRPARRRRRRRRASASAGARSTSSSRWPPAKQPQFSSRTLAEQRLHPDRDRPGRGRLRAARAFLLDELAAAWDEASAGGAIGVDRAGSASASPACTR